MNRGCLSREFVVRCWQAGVDAVNGEHATRRALTRDRCVEIPYLLAVGKAAISMCQGALEWVPSDGKVLVIAKSGDDEDCLSGDKRVTVFASSHPVPDERSLQAGRLVVDFVKQVPSSADLTVLVSGGASALVECLPDTVPLDSLRALTRQLLADGYSIDQINHIRIQLSLVKGGKLLRQFRGRRVGVYAISDVPDDDIDLIGSGIGSRHPPSVKKFTIPSYARDLMYAGKYSTDRRNPGPDFAYRACLVASNAIARQAAAHYARTQEVDVVVNEPSLNDDIHQVAERIGRQLREGPPGAYVWGGESTVILPERPGQGGRNQSLALALAAQIEGRSDITLIAAGTDGSDGPTEAAGGIVNGNSFRAHRGAQQALRNADAGSYLARIGGLYAPGPTGTNVMDLVIARVDTA